MSLLANCVDFALQVGAPQQVHIRMNSSQIERGLVAPPELDTYKNIEGMCLIFSFEQDGSKVRLPFPLFAILDMEILSEGRFRIKGHLAGVEIEIVSK